MKHYLIPKVRGLFNSFLTKKFNRSTNVALAGNAKIGAGLKNLHLLTVIVKALVSVWASRLKSSN